MRFIILLLLFGLIGNGFCRSSLVSENESNVYAEYDEKEPAADEYTNEKQDKEVDAPIQEDDGVQNLMDDKLDTTNNENVDNAEAMPLSGHHKSNSRQEDTEENDDYLQTRPHARFNAYKRNQNNNDYISGDADVSSNYGNMDNHRRTIKDKSEYSEAIHDHPLYKQITYYNKVQGDVFHKKKPNSIFNSNRDRRETGPNQQENINGDPRQDKEDNNEDSVSAIKRNIKKLSREELEDLLNSLSDDKRALLNKIISNKLINDNVNKREITKKAGAVEENIFENSRSDLNKLESGSSVDSVSALSQSETTETTKQTDSSEMSKTISPETDQNTSPCNESKDELNDSNQESIQNVDPQSKDSDGKEKLKNENKRETNIDEISQGKPEIIDSSNYDSIKDSESELMKDESDLLKAADDYSNTADVKSLEDSFPYYEGENTKSDSQLAPLIRVKRTNIRRSFDRLAKVPYFPEAVNDDNVKDEFNDGSNFENAYNNEKVYDLHSENCENSEASGKIENDSANIGSDTDNVLSNGGIDDNLMYNIEIRKKRVADDANANNLQQESPKCHENGSDSLLKNELHHQDQDTFGALHGSSEELGRYKRIRRLKMSPSTENSV